MISGYSMIPKIPDDTYDTRWMIHNFAMIPKHDNPIKLEVENDYLTLPKT